MYTSPDYPSYTSMTGYCNQYIELLDENVVQLKIEMVEFVLGQPDEDGQCTSDKFMVTGAAVISTIPVLCGVNTGQHSELDGVYSRIHSGIRFTINLNRDYIREAE